jgi:Glycosyl transferase family 2
MMGAMLLAPASLVQQKRIITQCMRQKRRYVLASIALFATGAVLNLAFMHVRVLDAYLSEDELVLAQTFDVPPGNTSIVEVDPEVEGTLYNVSEAASEKLPAAVAQPTQLPTIGSRPRTDDEREDELALAQTFDVPPGNTSIIEVDPEVEGTLYNVSEAASEKLLAAEAQPTQLPTIGSRTDDERSVSACLLIKDDNDILPEWIAYHYHSLGLRYLLVAVDPSSVTSPTPILDTWRANTDMHIVEWFDEDFMDAEFLRKGYHTPMHRIEGDASKSRWHEGYEDVDKVKADNLQIANHRYRQLTFLSACFRHMREHNRTWTIHVDTDEFIVVNPLLRNTTQRNVQMIKVGSVVTRSSILDVVRQFYRHRKLRRRFNYPCVTMPRLLFGSVEDASMGRITVSSNALYKFNASRFETLRWKLHTAYDDTERNAQPKVIVDVSTVPLSDQMFDKPFSIHRPSSKLCRKIDQLNFRHLQRYPITVNHYIGSWERYFFAKNDTRRSKRTYDMKAHVSDGFDDWITSWLPSFISVHGTAKATALLSDYTTGPTVVE